MRKEIVNLRRMEEIVLDIQECQVFHFKDFHKISITAHADETKDQLDYVCPIKIRKKNN